MSGSTTRGMVLLAAAAAVAMFVVPAVALAFDEDLPIPSDHGVPGYCEKCHVGGCGDCHQSHMMGFDPTTTRGKGPHGSYSSTTNTCSVCHTLHGAVGAQLLPATTVVATCDTCHDGTGGQGVYGTIKARTGLDPGAQHRIDTTSTVPGGSSTTGGNATLAFGGPGGMMSCDDCHSPHDANTVAPFTGDRQRTVLATWALGVQTYGTNRLLKQCPGDATQSVTSYGSDWCLACHRGRNSVGATHNHPVESFATAAVPYTYNNLPILVSDNLTSSTVLGSMGRTNRGYLMPYPRTAQQTGHNPICQQCHEDSRFVGTLTDAGADAATFTISAADGTTSSDDPRFQNFPHETVNPSMLVETNDDLCLNCHTPSSLP
jgi:hypothetical protein